MGPVVVLSQRGNSLDADGAKAKLNPGGMKSRGDRDKASRGCGREIIDYSEDTSQGR